MGAASEPPDLLPGTLDLLSLRRLAALHVYGDGLAQHIRGISDAVSRVGESFPYSGIQRVRPNGWVKAEWGTSENNRRARCDTLALHAGSISRRNARSPTSSSPPSGRSATRP